MGRSNRENKQCHSNVVGDRDLVLLNIDGPVMGHEIYMEQWADICIICVRRRSCEMEMEACSSEKQLNERQTKTGERHQDKTRILISGQWGHFFVSSQTRAFPKMGINILLLCLLLLLILSV